MNFKSIVYFFLLSNISLFAGIQNGKTIPDYITIHNSSTAQEPIIVEDQSAYQGETITLFTNGIKKSFIIQHGDQSYRITCPTYNKNDSISKVLSTITLDFATIEWLATKKQQSLDQLCIKNDTLYKIAVVYILNKLRAPARIAQPNETVSKVVHNTKDPEKYGRVAISLLDAKPEVYEINFLRRSLVTALSNPKHNSYDWRTITLSANTLRFFSNGFTVTIL